MKKLTNTLIPFIFMLSCLSQPTANFQGTMGYDDDGDGYSELDGDCDDRNPDRFPGNLELCDGIDNDCDDETVDSVDEDQDGVFCDLDCDDQNPFITPGREEICDGIDNDCDPRTTASINEQGEPCDKE